MNFSENTTMQEIMDMNDTMWNKTFNIINPVSEKTSKDNSLTIQPEYNPYDSLMDKIIEDIDIIDNAIDIHSSKRYNKKYIAARKFLIKDKRHLYLKGQSFSNVSEYGQSLYSKNVIRNENQNILHTVTKKKIKTIIPIKVIIDYSGYNEGRLNYYQGEYTFKDLVTIEETELSYILTSLTKKDYFCSRGLVTVIAKKHITSFYKQEMNHLKYTIEIGEDSDTKELDYHYNRKIYFYGKPVQRHDYCENVFIGLSNKREDSHWFNYKREINNKNGFGPKLSIKLGLEDYENELEDLDRSLYCEFEDEDYYDNCHDFNISYYEEPEHYWKTTTHIGLGILEELDILEEQDKQRYFDECDREDYYYDEFWDSYCEDDISA